jgi:hypothetical protein
MDGLIEQAKAQLWNMVNTLGRVKCDDNSKPQIEVSLYEYGRSSNSAANGYVKQLVSFTQDLDSISKFYSTSIPMEVKNIAERLFIPHWMS